MPAISLVVCVHRERELLARLLQKTAGLYDDLVVVHDGPAAKSQSQITMPAEILEQPPAIDYSSLGPESPLPKGYKIPGDPPKPGTIHELVNAHGGRYFEGPRSFQQEPHWPFAWSRAKHEWILRMDADEFPSEELTSWMLKFRNASEPLNDISGYTCAWPVWNGSQSVTKRWPRGRNFLFNRNRVRFFGMAEQTPIPDGTFESLPFILHHQPARRSHGIRNVLLRKQAYAWRRLIAHALLGRPVDLPQWRLGSENWPERWAEVRRHPLRTALSRLILDSLRTFRDQWKAEKRIHFGIGVSGPIHHALFCIQFWRLRRTLFQRNKKNGP